MKRRLTLVLAGAACAWSVHASELTVLPAPQKVEMGTGQFTFNKQTVVAADSSLTGAGDYLAGVLRRSTGLPLPRVGGTNLRRNAIVFRKAPVKLPPGAYRLEVGTQGAVVFASSADEAFSGCQTLLQLLPVEAMSTNKAAGVTWSVPCMKIEDAPRFAWRWLMLDESRHFFGKEKVKQILDVMAYLKMNRFHWHLTDEPGWRIQINKYPKLTEVGAVGNWSNAKAPAAFYTQTDIAEIVRYAQQRHIIIVPEIDMPGHATAATRAYPGVSGGGNGFTFNPASEQTYRFLEDVLTEVAGMFPGPFLHIGGDEVSFGSKSWKTDPQIQQFMRDNNLKNEAELERYFVRRVQGIIAKLGKTMMGWDEITAAGVDTNRTAVMWWRHDKPGVLDDALAKGYRVVLCPRQPCYFDFVQHDSHRIGRRWNGFNDLERVYDFPDPLQAHWKDRQAQVLGVEACLWTERVADAHRLDFMLFPRLAAIAEDGWSNATVKNKDKFLERVRVFLRYLDLRGVTYFNHFEPAKTPEPTGPNKADPLANG